MPWNNGGPGPWGKPSGSSGGDGDKKPTPGPWGNPGANKGGDERRGASGSGSWSATPWRPVRRRRWAIRRRCGPFGGGNQPDLDRLIAQAQAISAAFWAADPAVARAAAGSAASPTAAAWFCCCWRSSCFGSAAASTACSQTSRAWFCGSAPIPIGRRPVCIGTFPGRSKRWSFRPLPASTAPKSATAPRPAAMSKLARIPRAATSWPRA